MAWKVQGRECLGALGSVQATKINAVGLRMMEMLRPFPKNEATKKQNERCRVKEMSYCNFKLQTLLMLFSSLLCFVLF